ncbi:MAG: biopolymer transporter ExbD [bacterium]|nr:biopolymer transporter ExbD [bacterium]
MELKRRPGPSADLFTDSIADVSFLLVIFFIVTSVITASRGLDLAMPEEEERAEEVVMEESLDIHVTSRGGIEVDQQQMQIHEILPYIKERLQLAPDKPIILRTDADASYFQMIGVLDELRQSKKKIGMELDNLVIPTLREQSVYWE